MQPQRLTSYITTFPLSFKGLSKSGTLTRELPNAKKAVNLPWHAMLVPGPREREGPPSHLKFLHTFLEI